MQHHIQPTVQIWGNSGLPFAMVPCLHQCNVYIKRKLRVCRAQMCNPCFGAYRTLRSMGLLTTWFHTVLYRADSTNLREFGATYSHGTVFAPMQCLYQRKVRFAEPKNAILVTLKKSRRRSMGLQRTWFHAAPYRADREKFEGIRGYLSPWYCVFTNAMFISKGS